MSNLNNKTPKPPKAPKNARSRKATPPFQNMEEAQEFFAQHLRENAIQRETMRNLTSNLLDSIARQSESFSPKQKADLLRWQEEVKNTKIGGIENGLQN